MDPFLAGSALTGGLDLWGGFNQGKVDERRGYDRAVETRKLGSWMSGVGYPDFQKIWRDIGAGTFDPKSGKYGDNPLIDLINRGGMPGVRSEYMGQFLDNIKQGYKGAAGAIQGQGRHARQSALGAKQQGMADVGQSMQDSGLQSSNIAQQAKANVSYQTSKAIGEIDMELASMLSDLNISKAGAMDSALERNLALEGQNANELMNFFVGPAGFGPYAQNQGLGGYGYSGGASPNFGQMGEGLGGLMDFLQSIFK